MSESNKSIKLSSKNWVQLNSLIFKIIAFIRSPNTDTAWSEWNSPSEAIDYFNVALDKLKNNDESIIEELKIIFAPTGSLQELAISSGWGQEYLFLAKEFDQLIEA